MRSAQAIADLKHTQIDLYGEGDTYTREARANVARLRGYLLDARSRSRKLSLAEKEAWAVQFESAVDRLERFVEEALSRRPTGWMDAGSFRNRIRMINSYVALPNWLHLLDWEDIEADVDHLGAIIPKVRALPHDFEKTEHRDADRRRKAGLPALRYPTRAG